MLEIASQMVLCLLLAALIGFILGYLFCRMMSEKESCAHDVHETDNAHTHESADTAPAEAQALVSDTAQEGDIDEGVAPELLEAPRNGKKDNLTRIKGIGVKIEETLNNAGIFHFDQIAAWTEENIKWADANIAFPGRVKREKWVEQAKILAEGGETEFSKRVDAGEVATSKKS